MPATITLEQATGFGLFMLKLVLTSRGAETVDLAKVVSFVRDKLLAYEKATTG